MKKLLCYLGILLLLFLAFLPPILRIFLPDQDENQKENIINENIVIYCSNSEYIVSTNYENNEIKMLAFKKLNTNLESPEGENIDENQTLNSQSDLDKTFFYLKEANDIIYNITDDGEAIGIDFSISTHQELDINNITKQPTEQQKYYENQGLTCVVRK